MMYNMHHNHNLAKEMLVRLAEAFLFFFSNNSGAKIWYPSGGYLQDFKVCSIGFISGLAHSFRQLFFVGFYMNLCICIYIGVELGEGGRATFPWLSFSGGRGPN